MALFPSTKVLGYYQKSRKGLFPNRFLETHLASLFLTVFEQLDECHFFRFVFGLDALD
jgi:hypothetical protein